MRFELPLEKIPLRFGEEEQVLKIHREPVLDTRRDAVGFVPDDRGGQRPAAIDHFHGKSERDQHKRFPPAPRLWVAGVVGDRPAPAYPTGTSFHASAR